LDHIKEFDSRREGAFLAYMRQILMNLIRDEARRVGRRPEHGAMVEEIASSGPSPLDDAVGKDALERYDAALSKLSEEQRQAVILRVELGYTYAQIGEALGNTTGDAARMAVTRAIARLGRTMRAGDRNT
jgi:RNA polymerase sigma-70 factor (ECF subfamily)